jgi:CheY-like chemotaxis protein
MDLEMPDDDRWEAVRRLKNDPQTWDIPIIGMSAHAVESEREKGYDRFTRAYHRVEDLTMRVTLIFATLVAALLSSQAYAQTEWTPEESKAGIRKVEQTRYVRAGKQFSGSLTFVNTACVVLDADHTVTKEPEHGTVTIDIIEHHTNFSKDSARAKCNEKKVRGHVLQYKANAGYAGTDAFEVLSISQTGHATRYVITVNIIGDAKAKAGR